MDPMDDPELALEVPLRPIFDELCCPICFGAIEECSMTPCGHSFCTACILECLNRKHSCPCCNHATQREQLIRNHQHDRLVQVVQEEKKVAWDRYVEKVTNKPQDPADDDLTSSQKKAKQEVLSPVEQVFHKHMKRSLLSYEDYYKDLKAKYEASRAIVRRQLSSVLQERSTKTAKEKKKVEKGSSKYTLAQVQSRHDRKVQALTDDCERELHALEASFKNSVDLLIEQYEVYMEGFMPAREFLPVVVNVVLEGREEPLVVRNVTLARTDSVVELRTKVDRRLAEMGNPVHSWGKDIIFVLRLPFASAEDAGGQGGFREEVIIIDEQRPIVQYNAIQGSDVVVRGGIVLESDKPKTCFSVTYTKGAAMDYYRCNDCKINWVCKECVSGCHEGHSISEYIMGHKPSWNCCYCVKRKKCKIINNAKRQS